jgi:putative ABC transport system substrate-binding protein
MDLRWGGADINRIRALARIVTNATPPTAALQRETRTIPIVFAAVADPVGGSTTRVGTSPEAPFEATLGGKWLELFSEIAPGLKRATIMFNPDSGPVSILMPSLETAARSLEVVQIIAPVHSNVEIETAVIALGCEPGGGLVVMPDVFALGPYWRRPETITQPRPYAYYDRTNSIAS